MQVGHVGALLADQQVARGFDEGKMCLVRNIRNGIRM